MSGRTIRRCLALCPVFFLALMNGAPATAQAPLQKPGGSATIVFINDVWTNIDPAHDGSPLLQEVFMNEIFGGLFTETPSGGIAPEMAESWHFADDSKKLVINLRQNIKFSDGTPLNAAAVVYNIKRDLIPANGCVCGNDFAPVTSIDATGPYQVTLTTSVPDPELVEGFIDEPPNWPESVQAIKATPPAKLAISPVGAGPYTVTSFSANTKVVLQRNPAYWQKGLPYLNQLTFLNTASDEDAYSALQSGTAQMVVGMSTAPIIEQAKSSYNSILVPGTVVTTLELNVYKPPFNNIKAREAVAYALNGTQLLNAVGKGLGVPVEGEQGPGGVFYEKRVPGFLPHNLPKAKALVQQLGGLSMQIQGGTSAANSLQLDAIQSELAAAGIKVTLDPISIVAESANITSGNFQAVTGASGGIDPDISVQSLVDRYSSKGIYTCCKDPALDQLIASSAQTVGNSARQAAFDKVYAYITKNVYVVPLYALGISVVSSKKLVNVKAGPGVSNITPFIDLTNVSIG